MGMISTSNLPMLCFPSTPFFCAALSTNVTSNIVWDVNPPDQPSCDRMQDNVNESSVALFRERFSHLPVSRNQTRYLERLLSAVGSVQDPKWIDCLYKTDNYWDRLFGNESWEEWTDARSSLGKVFAFLENPVRAELSRSVILEAEQQAKKCLKQIMQKV